MAHTSERSYADRPELIGQSELVGQSELIGRSEPIGRSGLMGRLKNLLTRHISLWLTHQHLPFALSAFSMLLALPGLWSGFAIDDYFHKITIQGWPIHLLPQGVPAPLDKLARPSLDIFNFLGGGPSQIRYFIEKGFIPWWTLESVKLDFWRPVSALTHWLDYQLWPNSPFAMHLHSLLWFGLATVMVTFFYRRFIAVPWVAGLAAILYAIDDAHTIPVIWLANRNVLIALFFGTAAAIFHDRWRRDRRTSAALLAPLCLGVALLAKEEAITICGYLIAYTLFLDQDLWPKRAASLTPYVLVVAVWRIIYRATGHGVWGLEWYIDPLISPRRFIDNFLLRATKLLLGQFALVEIDSLGSIVMRPLTVAFLIGFFLITLAFLWRDRLAWFWFTGMMLAVIPACTSLPNDRMLFFIGLGAMGLLAQLFFALNNALKSATGPSHHAGYPALPAFRHAMPTRGHAMATLRQAMVFIRQAMVYPLCFILIVIHLLLATVLWPVRIYGFSAWSKSIDHSIETAPLDDTVSHKTVVVVNALGCYPIYLQIIRALKGQSVPRYMRNLASDLGYTVPIRISRTDDRTLIVEPEGGFIWTFFRDRSHPLSVGSRVVLPGMTAEVTKLAQGGWPQEVRYRFSSPLEDPSLVWLQIHHNASVPFKLPAIGETLVLGNNDK